MIPLSRHERHTLEIIYRRHKQGFEPYSVVFDIGYIGLWNRGLAYSDDGFAVLTEQGLKLAEWLYGDPA